MTTDALPPLAADQIGPLLTGSAYPPALAALVQGRGKRKLGDHFGLTNFGLTNFGINLTELAPGAISALFHRAQAGFEGVLDLLCIAARNRAFGAEAMLTGGRLWRMVDGASLVGAKTVIKGGKWQSLCRNR